MKVVALNNDNISVKETLKLDGVVQGTPTSVTKCVGGTYTPDLSAVEGTFMFWTVNGAVRTDLPQDYTFKVTSKLELVAHFASTGKYSVAYLDANTKLIDVEYVDDTGVLTPPTLESTLVCLEEGASFDGWALITNYEAPASTLLENPGAKAYLLQIYCYRSGNIYSYSYRWYGR